MSMPVEDLLVTAIVLGGWSLLMHRIYGGGPIPETVKALFLVGLWWLVAPDGVLVFLVGAPLLVASAMYEVRRRYRDRWRERWPLIYTGAVVVAAVLGGLADYGLGRLG